eukprot:2797968-Rhodomonas_salina.1
MKNTYTSRGKGLEEQNDTAEKGKKTDEKEEAYATMVMAISTSGCANSAAGDGTSCVGKSKSVSWCR